MEKHKRYQDMTTKELREATKEFDEPWTGKGLPGKPLTAAQRRRWQRIQAKMRSEQQAKRMGRPKVGQGAKVVALSIEQGLLRRTDAFARRQGLSRAAVVAEGLEHLLHRSA